MPGKVSANGFLIFMHEFRSRQEKRGIRYSSMEAVVEPAGQEWAAMSYDLKMQYKTKAQEYRTSGECRNTSRFIKKGKVQSKPTAKFEQPLPTKCFEAEDAADDFEILDLEDAVRLKQRSDNERQALNTMINWQLANVKEELLVEPFVVLAVQNYYTAPDNSACAAEVALIQFTLQHGIAKVCHAILKPDEFHENMRPYVSNQAMQTHQLCPGRLPGSARNSYRLIVNDMKRLYSSAKKYAKTYVLPHQYNDACGAIVRLRRLSGSKQLIPLDTIFCLDNLYAVLRQNFGRPMPHAADAKLFASTLFDQPTPWDFDSETLCDFHNCRKVKYCALGIARKACFMLFCRMSEVFDFPITDKHVPVKLQRFDFTMHDLELENLTNEERAQQHERESQKQQNAATKAATSRYYTETYFPPELTSMYPQTVGPTMQVYDDAEEAIAELRREADADAAARALVNPPIFRDDDDDIFASDDDLEFASGSNFTARHRMTPAQREMADKLSQVRWDDELGGAVETKPQMHPNLTAQPNATAAPLLKPRAAASMGPRFAPPVNSFLQQPNANAHFANNNHMPRGGGDVSSDDENTAPSNSSRRNALQAQRGTALASFTNRPVCPNESRFNSSFERTTDFNIGSELNSSFNVLNLNGTLGSTQADFLDNGNDLYANPNFCGEPSAPRLPANANMYLRTPFSNCYTTSKPVNQSSSSDSSVYNIAAASSTRLPSTFGNIESTFRRGIGRGYYPTKRNPAT